MHFMHDCSMPLTLRPTGLSSPVYADQPDYIVCEDGKAVKRMYEDRHTPPDLRWFWSITVYINPKLGITTSGRAASIEDAKAQFLTNWQNWRIKTELEKRLALEVAEPRSLNPSRKRQMLDSQISKYVAVRRNRGEQMKAIVPASAKCFAVSERTVWVAVGGTDSRISAIQPT